ncbi:VOC family protein [Paenibacillus elgii]|nr:VOC family protein [Paenibacillus elgii]
MIKHIKRIDTVFVPVTDISRSKEWYMNLFNFRVVYESPDGSYVGFRFNESGPLQTGLTLYQTDQLPESRHIAFNFYTTDVDASYAYFTERQVRTSEIHGAGGMRFFDAWDPDGNGIGVVTFPE